MFVYNITLNMDVDIEATVLDWIKVEFIPKAMKEGLFHEFQLCKLRFADQETPAYAIQFYCSGSMDFDQLLNPVQSKYLEWIADRFGLQVMSFASILDILEPAYLSFIHKN